MSILPPSALPPTAASSSTSAAIAAAAAAAADVEPAPPTSGEPLSVTTGAHTFDVQFHPSQPIVASSTIEGTVELHRFDFETRTSKLRKSLSCHKESCRTLGFLSANNLASAAADAIAAVTDIETGKRVWRAKMKAAGNALLQVDEQRFAVGDDDGGLRLFDVREKKAIVRYAENEDYISDLALGADKYSLCATSGDGTFAVYDLRKAGTPGLVAMSDFQEDEYLCVDVLRSGTKVVCGSQSGPLAIFSWGDFGDFKDRVKGHTTSVDSLIKIDEDAILTGSADGKVRVATIYHKEHGSCVLGIVAEHGDFPVERLALSPCGELFASASHGQPAVRVWSIEDARKLLAGEPMGDAAAGAEEGGEKQEEEPDSDDSDEPPAKKQKKRKKGKKGSVGGADAKKKVGSFFGGL